MPLREEAWPELERLMGTARQATLTRRQEQRLRALLADGNLRALTMSREELFDHGFLVLGLRRMMDVAEGRAKIVYVE